MFYFYFYLLQFRFYSLPMSSGCQKNAICNAIARASFEVRQKNCLTDGYIHVQVIINNVIFNNNNKNKNKLCLPKGHCHFSTWLVTSDACTFCCNHRDCAEVWFNRRCNLPTVIWCWMCEAHSTIQASMYESNAASCSSGCLSVCMVVKFSLVMYKHDCEQTPSNSSMWVIHYLSAPSGWECWWRLTSKCIMWHHLRFPLLACVTHMTFQAVRSGGLWPFNFITLPHGQPHAIFRGFTPISEGWMQLCKEFVVAEDSPHRTMQRTTTF